MNRLLRLLLAGLLVALATPSSPAQSLAARLDALQQGTRVELALAMHPALRVYRFEARVQGDVATLSGIVQTVAERQQAAEVARTVPGITTVRNEVRLATEVEGDLPAASEVMDTPDEEGAAEQPPVVTPTPTPSASTTPPASTRPAATQATYHTVRRGDTLYRISSRYGVSVDELRRLNNLRGSDIRIGQRLRVR